MGFRFQRRIKIMSGVTLNVGKRGVSTSIGRRGAHITFGQNGVRTTVGIPGTGISYTSLSKSSHAPEAGSREASWPHLAKCPYCGYGMRKRWDRCPACHQVLEQPLPDVVGLKYCPHCGFEVSTKKNRQAFWGKFFYCLFVAILMIALFVMM